MRELARLLGDGALLTEVPARYLVDATEGRGVRGRADALALPSSPEDVAGVVAWCYEHDVAVVPRGGGTGLAGGAVPLDGGVVLSLERLDRIRSLEPALWRAEAEAGVTTATLRRRARESGLLFGPDPGAAEQSQLGGNIATNAGGPHAFKYGVTGAWVTGLEAVLAPGELVRLGGAVRKDVAGYDLRALLTGSEGTLGVVTAAWLRLVPAPEARLPVAAFHADAGTGAAAVLRVMEAGVQPAALEFLDAGALRAAGGSYPGGAPAGAGFLVLAEADGASAEAERVQGELAETLGPGAVRLDAPRAAKDVEALWRWRDGVSLAVSAQRGGKVSEDIAVPLEHLAEAIAETVAIGARHGLEALSWGHAGDGNLHSTFLVDPGDGGELDRARAAAAELFALAVRLGGTVSGEHGIGVVKRGAPGAQWDDGALRAHEAVKRALDPKGLLNPGKKTPR